MVKRGRADIHSEALVEVIWQTPIDSSLFPDISKFAPCPSLPSTLSISTPFVEPRVAPSIWQQNGVWGGPIPSILSCSLSEFQAIREQSRAGVLARVNKLYSSNLEDSNVDINNDNDGVHKKVKPSGTITEKEKKQRSLHEMHLLRTMARGWSAIFERNHCLDCWVFKRHCVCSQLQKMAIACFASVKKPPRHRIVVIYNHMEVFRAANSGKLISFMIPNTLTFVWHYAPHMITLFSLLESSGNVVIMCPNSGSITAAEAVELYCNKNQSISYCSKEIDDDSTPSLTIVLFEGTWRGVKTMNRDIPKIYPRVRLAPEDFKLPNDNGDLQNDINSVGTMKETRDGGMQTATATACILSIFRERQPYIDSLLSSMKLLSKHYRIDQHS